MNWLVLRRFGTQPPWQCFFLGMMITLILYSFSSIFLNWLTQNPNLLILICRSVLAPKSMDGNTNPSSNSVLPLSVLHVVETLHPMGFSKENEEFTNFRDMSLDVLSGKIFSFLFFLNLLLLVVWSTFEICWCCFLLVFLLGF